MSKKKFIASRSANCDRTCGKKSTSQDRMWLLTQSCVRLYSTTSPQSRCLHIMLITLTSSRGLSSGMYDMRKIMVTLLFLVIQSCVREFVLASLTELEVKVLASFKEVLSLTLADPEGLIPVLTKCPVHILNFKTQLNLCEMFRRILETISHVFFQIHSFSFLWVLILVVNVPWFGKW